MTAQKSSAGAPGSVNRKTFPHLADEIDDAFAADDAAIRGDNDLTLHVLDQNPCSNPGGHLYFQGWCLHCDREEG